MHLLLPGQEQMQVLTGRTCFDGSSNVPELPVSMSCLMSINGRSWLIIKMTCSEAHFGYLGTGNMTFHWALKIRLAQFL